MVLKKNIFRSEKEKRNIEKVSFKISIKKSYSALICSDKVTV
jgi:hypothetical protein